MVIRPSLELLDLFQLLIQPLEMVLELLRVLPNFGLLLGNPVAELILRLGNDVLRFLNVLMDFDLHFFRPGLLSFKDLLELVDFLNFLVLLVHLVVKPLPVLEPLRTQAFDVSCSLRLHLSYLSEDLLEPVLTLIRFKN